MPQPKAAHTHTHTISERGHFLANIFRSGGFGIIDPAAQEGSRSMLPGTGFSVLLLPLGTRYHPKADFLPSSMVCAARGTTTVFLCRSKSNWLSHAEQEAAGFGVIDHPGL